MVLARVFRAAAHFGGEALKVAMCVFVPLLLLGPCTADAAVQARDALEAASPARGGVHVRGFDNGVGLPARSLNVGRP